MTDASIKPADEDGGPPDVGIWIKRRIIVPVITHKSHGTEKLGDDLRSCC